MSNVFERELKGILQGEEDMLVRTTRSCGPEEKEAYFKIIRKPFLVIRAAGSLGVDLIAVRGDVSFPIEVKSSVSNVLRFSRSERLIVQAEEFMAMCRRSNLMPIYAYRLKNFRGDSWRMFTVDMENLEGIIGTVHRRLPKVERTREGNMVLRWKEGMPLANFIDWLCP